MDYFVPFLSREGWSYVYGIQNSEMEPNELELALRNGLIRKIIMELSKRLSLRGWVWKINNYFSRNSDFLLIFPLNSITYFFCAWEPSEWKVNSGFSQLCLHPLMLPATCYTPMRSPQSNPLSGKPSSCEFSLVPSALHLIVHTSGCNPWCICTKLPSHSSACNPRGLLPSETTRSANTRDKQMAKGQNKNIISKRQHNMALPELSYSTSASPGYPNTPIVLKKKKSP